MINERELIARSGSKCELCGSEKGLRVHEVQPAKNGDLEHCAYICETCESQYNDPSTIDPNHWRCLNKSMWSEVPAVQVLAYRMLHNIKDVDWTQDMIDMMYMDEEQLEWAEAAGIVKSGGIKHVDSNGVELQAGDTVVLIKDLKVKGSSMVAKRGTSVRRISLDHDNPKFIEGKVDGVRIVIITDYVKKSK